ncbi:hypothetical protein PM082_017056 [Marasmius tenuissimus]|nr:hypothetical protein PM082_017056 [Marasmius tenuissimus]
MLRYTDWKSYSFRLRKFRPRHDFQRPTGPLLPERTSLPFSFISTPDPPEWYYCNFLRHYSVRYDRFSNAHPYLQQSSTIQSSDYRTGPIILPGTELSPHPTS